MCALISHNGVNKNTPCWRGWSFDPRDRWCHRAPSLPEPSAEAHAALTVCKVSVNSYHLRRLCAAHSVLRSLKYITLEPWAS